MSEVEALKHPVIGKYRNPRRRKTVFTARRLCWFTYIITFLALLAFFLFKSKIGEQPDKAIL